MAAGTNSLLKLIESAMHITHILGCRLFLRRFWQERSKGSTCTPSPAKPSQVYPPTAGNLHVFHLLRPVTLTRGFKAAPALTADDSPGSVLWPGTWT